MSDGDLTRLDPTSLFGLDGRVALVTGAAGGVGSVAIALLAPASDAARSWGPTRTRARHVAAVVAGVLGQEIEAHIARYDDSFEPRAFGADHDDLRIASDVPAPALECHQDGALVGAARYQVACALLRNNHLSDAQNLDQLRQSLDIAIDLHRQACAVHPVA